MRTIADRSASALFPFVGVEAVVCAALLLFAPTPTRAQQDDEPSSVTYSASAEGSLATGNVRRMLLTLRGDMTWTGSTLGVAADQSFVYGEQGDAVRERDVHDRVFLYLYPRRRWFGFAVGGYETSRPRRLDHRWQLGVGIGRRLWETPAHNLRVTFAVLRERAQLDDDTATDQWRTTMRMKGSHRQSRFRLQEEMWWQPAFRGAPGQRWHAQASFDVTIVRGLAFRTSIEEHYESHIAPGLRSNDLRLTCGIAIGSE